MRLSFEFLARRLCDCVHVVQLHERVKLEKYDLGFEHSYVKTQGSESSESDIDNIVCFELILSTIWEVYEHIFCIRILFGKDVVF